MRFTDIIKVSAVVALMTIAGSASAAQFMVYGAGTESCGSWLASRESHNWYADGQWLLGFISGIGDESDAELMQTDSDALAAWIDNYCKAHPIDTLQQAAEHLSLFLMSKAEKKRQ